MGEQGITTAIIKGNTQYDRIISVNAVAVILLLYLYAVVKNRPVICRPTQYHGSSLHFGE